MWARDVPDPQADYLSRYRALDVVKKFSIDVNGDGTLDYFFTTIEANPDRETARARMQDGDLLPWSLYISNPGGKSFRTTESTISLDPRSIYVGYVPQVKKRGLVIGVDEQTRNHFREIIYVYTWEKGRLIEKQLAEFGPTEGSKIFESYLSEAKRTKTVVHQIKP